MSFHSGVHRSVISAMIEMYKERPCLWQIACPEYTNKKLKDRAYEEIASFVRENGYPDCIVKDVKDKIQNLRRCVRKETKKIEESRNAEDLEDEYIPTLWYYKSLEFLITQENSKDPLNNVSIDSDTNVSVGDDDSEWQDDYHEAQEAQPSETSRSEIYKKTPVLKRHSFQTRRSDFKRPSTSSSASKGLPHKRIKMEQNINEFLECGTDESNASDVTYIDEYRAMGLNYAAKMKKMDDRQRIFAELLIQKVITKGLLEQLNESTDITSNPAQNNCM